MKHPKTAALAKSARAATGLSQANFATLIWMGVRTIADWEGGEKEPSGAARVLLGMILLGVVNARTISLLSQDRPA